MSRTGSNEIIGYQLHCFPKQKNTHFSKKRSTLIISVSLSMSTVFGAIHYGIHWNLNYKKKQQFLVLGASEF